MVRTGLEVDTPERRTGHVRREEEVQARREMPHVLDISSWQPDRIIDWDQLRNHNPDLVAVYIKTSEGTTYRSPERQAQFAGARSVGFEVGAYHYARPSWGSAVSQADAFLASIPRGGSTLRPMLDLEWGSSIKGPPLYLWIRNFCERVHRKTGVRPILYTYPAWWEQYVIAAGAMHQEAVEYLSHRLLWIAHYGTLSPRVPAPWDHWTLWQHTSTKRRTGIADPTVDDSYLAVPINWIRLSRVQRHRFSLSSKTPSKGV